MNGWIWNIYYDGYPWTWLDDDQLALKAWPTAEEAAADARREWGEDAEFQLIQVVFQ